MFKTYSLLRSLPKTKLSDMDMHPAPKIGAVITAHWRALSQFNRSKTAISRWKLLSPLIFIFTLISCSLETKSTLKAPDASKLQLLNNDEKLALIKLTENILKDYPPDRYNYIFLGQSPTPLYAIISDVAHEKSHIHAVSLPLSQVHNMKYSLYFNSIDRDNTYYIKKLFDHFDVFLGKTIDKIGSNQAPMNFVIIDFTVSGESLGVGKRTIDWYLRFKASHHPNLKAMIERSGQFPNTEFLGLIHPEESSADDVLKTINSLKRPFQSRHDGILNLNQVVPGNIRGTEPIAVNIRELSATLNQKTLPDEWHWQGKVISLNETQYPGIGFKFFWEDFEPFSPYGKWNLFDSPLEDKEPTMRESFSQLKEHIISCD